MNPSPPAADLINREGKYEGRAAALGRTLTEVLSAQRGLYIQLAALARQQSQFIAEAASDKLMATLAARSRIIDEMSPLDRQLQPYKDKWHDVLASLAENDRSNVSTLLTQVQQLLSDILEQDEADRQTLIRQKDHVASQITHTVTGRQLNRAYNVKPRAQPPGVGLG